MWDPTTWVRIFELCCKECIADGGRAYCFLQNLYWDIENHTPKFHLRHEKKFRVGNFSSRYGARNRFQEPSLELSSQAT
jgi:hypothetical protein